MHNISEFFKDSLLTLYCRDHFLVFFFWGVLHDVPWKVCVLHDCSKLYHQPKLVEKGETAFAHILPWLEKLFFFFQELRTSTYHLSYYYYQSSYFFCQFVGINFLASHKIIEHVGGKKRKGVCLTQETSCMKITSILPPWHNFTSLSWHLMF